MNLDQIRRREKIDFNRIAEMAEHRRAQVRQEANVERLLRASRPVTLADSIPEARTRRGSGIATRVGSWLGFIAQRLRENAASPDPGILDIP